MKRETGYIRMRRGTGTGDGRREMGDGRWEEGYERRETGPWPMVRVHIPLIRYSPPTGRPRLPPGQPSSHSPARQRDGMVSNSSEGRHGQQLVRGTAWSATESHPYSSQLLTNIIDTSHTDTQIRVHTAHTGKQHTGSGGNTASSVAQQAQRQRRRLGGSKTRNSSQTVYGPT